MSGYDFRDACEAGDLDKVKGKLMMPYAILQWERNRICIIVSPISK